MLGLRSILTTTVAMDVEVPPLFFADRSRRCATVRPGLVLPWAGRGNGFTLFVVPAFYLLLACFPATQNSEASQLAFR